MMRTIIAILFLAAVRRGVMKVSKLRASENRDAIVQAAATQIRARGFGEMSVADVAKEAGLTHGALYSHFASKDALQAAAIERAFDQCLAEFSELTPEQFLGRYLSTQHRDNPEHGCPTAALVSEMRQQSDEARTAFHDGLTRFAALAGDSLAPPGTGRGKDFTVLAFAAMVGGLAISRAIRDVDQAASDEVLRAVADQLRQATANPPETDGTGTSRKAKPTRQEF